MAISLVNFLTGYRLFRGEDLNNNFSTVPVTYLSTAAQTANATTTYAAIPGLSGIIIPSAGIFQFSAVLPSTVASGTGGIKYSFGYSNGLALSALQSSGVGCTASATAVQNVTSTTSGADLFTQAAVVIMTNLDGVMTVSSPGTLAVQMAQNTSNASNSVAIIGATLQLTRIG